MTLVSPRLFAAIVAGTALSACSGPFDPDFRGNIGAPFDTSEAALRAAAGGPNTAAGQPVNQGVVEYADGRAVLANEGETVAQVAARFGLSPEALARQNNRSSNDRLASGTVLRLPPNAQVASGGPDVTALASGAIDRAQPTPVTSGVITPAATTPAPALSSDAIRHRVQRNETVYSIARLYGISPRALVDANGLDSNFTISVGQVLVVPATSNTTSTQQAAVSPPGQGSATPVPPSASSALPNNTAAAAPVVAAAAKPAAPAADIGQAAAAEKTRMAMPVKGSIIREYAPGRNEGIDIAAPAGTPVSAADAGTVAAITRSTNNINIVLVRHEGDLVSIYTHLDDLKIGEGDALTRGQRLGSVRAGDPAFIHFELRKGSESVDPMSYLR